MLFRLLLCGCCVEVMYAIPQLTTQDSCMLLALFNLTKNFVITENIRLVIENNIYGRSAVGRLGFVVKRARGYIRYIYYFRALRRQKRAVSASKEVRDISIAVSRRDKDPDGWMPDGNVEPGVFRGVKDGD